MNKKKQYCLYALFAGITTVINIGTQRIIEVLFSSIIKWDFFLTPIKNGSKITYGLIIMMFIAKILAFLFKYTVDKHFIFKDKTTYFSIDHLKQFILYGSFAVITTLIFWATELSFKTFVNYKYSHYIGALLGLTMGYILKFLLDNKFVFNNSNKNEENSKNI